MPDKFQTQGIRGRRDPRGLVSLTVPWYCSSLEETMTVGEATVLGLPEVGRDLAQVEMKDKFLVNISYEGLMSDAGDMSTFEFEDSFSEDPIETHPEFEQLKKDYNGSIDPSTKRVVWPEILKSGSSGSQNGLLGVLTAGKQGKNPLYGLTTYLAQKGIWRRTFLVKKLPANLFDSIGQVFSSLPTEAKDMPVPKDRNWLFIPPKLSWKGNCWEVGEQLMMSPPGGWPPQVYKLIQR
jgi:hypothetical protein